MLTEAGCQTRQERFRTALAQANVDAAIISDPRDVYYLTGLLPDTFPLALYLTAGDSLLVGPTDEGPALVDERLTYPTNTLYTLNPDPVTCLAAVLEPRLSGRTAPRRLGWQTEALPHALGEVVARTLAPDAWQPIDGLLVAQQQRKEPDEVALLRAVNRVNLAAYTAAEATIAPGVNELEVLSAAQRAATLAAGEVVRLGGDYRSAAFGGPARDRTIGAGELYIIDSGVSYRGYWSDLARTFAVGEPSDIQRSVYAHVAEVLASVEQQLRPGVDGADVWRWLDGRLREHPYLRASGLVTHGGHGIGVHVHEMPDINRDRGGLLQAGCVVTCEPGGYGPELNAGIRLENAFLITDTGVENLSPYPLTLA
ncbi:MAG: aminopeptidase P family protein [Chloroflexi bacterium]|nr:aminopeptidase P family protein [Chloroflexota bacterium]